MCGNNGCSLLFSGVHAAPAPQPAFNVLKDVPMCENVRNVPKGNKKKWVGCPTRVRVSQRGYRMLMSLSNLLAPSLPKDASSYNLGEIIEALSSLGVLAPDYTYDDDKDTWVPKRKPSKQDSSTQTAACGLDTSLHQKCNELLEERNHVLEQNETLEARVAERDEYNSMLHRCVDRMEEEKANLKRKHASTPATKHLHKRQSRVHHPPDPPDVRINRKGLQQYSDLKTYHVFRTSKICGFVDQVGRCEECDGHLKHNPELSNSQYLVGQLVFVCNQSDEHVYVLDGDDLTKGKDGN